MQAELERVEVEPALRRDHDLAVEHAVLREALEERGVQVGKIAIQRAAIPALQEHSVCASKNQGAKTIPLRLVQVVAVGDRISELGEHGLDGWLRRQCRGFFADFAIPSQRPAGSGVRRPTRR